MSYPSGYINKESTVPAKTRQTKYCQAIIDVMHHRSHASNAEILEELRLKFPELSATTVHRATARLAARGDLILAPPTLNGAMRYDINTTPHDHFSCSKCGRLVDTDVAKTISRLLASKIEGCHISGRIVISGTCKECTSEQNPFC